MAWRFGFDPSPERTARRSPKPSAACLRSLVTALIQQLTATDDRHHLAWAALPLTGGDPPGYGAASIWREDGDPASAEFSVTVADEFQDRGVGTLLLAILWIEGRKRGVETFLAHVLESNLAARAWFESLGASATRHQRHWTFRLRLDASLLDSSSASEKLRRRLEELQPGLPL